ncbi:glutamate--tRNA ligase [uncultured Ferrovibrio sp.]|jgi:glutamyl-tRNA synthetase|uniref:glutamate--tRNA ligase n=1 Tax=uncultured Ferrovibrio sp. TaxID=1576913 RepID=UPI00263680A7|nr:glutamate--tRNA ligase [uncultured Ferrovibrio sp.]
MKVVTRFAPSPTGYLHIGGARTALFNWLFARHHGGTFLLRIEDTDRERSTQDAVDKIFEGLKWLGIDWDGEPVFQFARMKRHAEVAHKMLAEGKAYYCYCTPEELEEMRAKAKAEGKPMRYDGRWRDRDPKDAPAGVKPVVRFKAPREGVTVIKDHVQGDVTFQNEQLDDLIILRSDGTPTYNLSVVVDDHDMGVTHVIRGDDHLTNAARQTQLYLAAGFEVPEFAHIPLIHGPDGAKLSKRHGALGTEAYADMGYLPAAMRNYLLRLGWSHGDDEIISTEQAIEWFGLDHVGRSPARFDFAKLNSLNGHYIRNTPDDELLQAALPFITKHAGRAPSEAEQAKLKAILPAVKERAKDLNELAEAVLFLFAARPIQPDAAAQKHLDDAAKARLRKVSEALQPLNEWTAASTEAVVRNLAETEQVKLGQLAQPLRAALTGRTVSPPIFDVLAVLGRDETLARLADAAGA